MKTFVCRGCMNPVTFAGHTSVDIGGDATHELVDKFCYLGDMLSVDGDADAAEETRIRIWWNKFRHFVPLLTNKDISLTVRWRLYSSYVWSSMLHGGKDTGQPFFCWSAVRGCAFPVARAKVCTSLPADVTSALLLPVFMNTLKTYLSSATAMTFSDISQTRTSLPSPQHSGPCNSFHCLGHCEKLMIDD